MNYKAIYYKLCRYAKTTSVRDRIRKRNPNDFRLGEDIIYTELHHIIPRHSGGVDEDYNLVELTFEEHFLAHLIRYKAYGDRNDFLAVGFMANGVDNGEKGLFSDIKESEQYTKSLNKTIMLYKTMITKFRKKTGWHTADGIRRISEARKGTMPVKDAETGEILGTFPLDHPNILSGKWVHHSSGKVSVIENSTGKTVYIESKEYQDNKHLYRSNNGDVSGTCNPTFCGYDNKKLFEIVKDFCYNIKDGIDVIPSYNSIQKMMCEVGINIPKTFSKYRRDELGSPVNFVSKIAEELGLSSYPFAYRSAYEKNLWRINKLKTNFEEYKELLKK